MKKVAIWVAAIGFFFVIIPFTYSTAKGYTRWYFLVPASQVTVSGMAVDAWIHRGQSGQDLIVTWGSPEARSYYLVPSSEFVDSRCPVAPRFPLFAEGDLLDSDCFQISDPNVTPPVQRKRNVQVKPRMFSFDDDAGRRIVVRW